MEKVQNYTDMIEKIGENCIQMLKDGSVRNHKLGNSAREHNAEEEEKESLIFAEFLITSNCDLVVNLEGKENV